MKDGSKDSEEEIDNLFRPDEAKTSLTTELLGETLVNPEAAEENPGETVVSLEVPTKDSRGPDEETLAEIRRLKILIFGENHESLNRVPRFGEGETLSSVSSKDARSGETTLTVEVETSLRNHGYPTEDADDSLWFLSGDTFYESVENERNAVPLILEKEFGFGIMSAVPSESVEKLKESQLPFGSTGNLLISTPDEELDSYCQGEADAIDTGFTRIPGSHRKIMDHIEPEDFHFSPQKLEAGIKTSLGFRKEEDDPPECLEEFFFVTIGKGNARSRRYQSNHYGVALAGYVSKHRQAEPVDLDLDDLVQCDPLNGLEHSYNKVVCSPEGLWPFGIVGSNKVAWCDVDVLTEVKKGNYYSLSRPKMPFGGSGIVCVDTGNKTENTYVGKINDFLRGTSGRVSCPLLVRKLIILYNSVFQNSRFAYEGAFPSIRRSDEEFSVLRLAAPLIFNFDRALTGSSVDDRGIAFDGESLYVDYFGPNVDFVDRQVRKVLSGVEEMDFEVKEEENILPLVSQVPCHRSLQSGNDLFSDFEVVVPGTTAVSSTSLMCLESFSADEESIPLLSAAVHPIAARAQYNYIRAVSQQGGTLEWMMVVLPERTVARRQRRDKERRVHHVGDTQQGSKVEHLSVVRVVPHVLLANVQGFEVERARDSLIRASYHYGSSLSDEVILAKVEWKKKPSLTSQSFVGLASDGRTECRIVEGEETVPIFSESEKEVCSRLRDTSSEDLRVMAVDWHRIKKDLGSSPIAETVATEEEQPVASEKPDVQDTGPFLETNVLSTLQEEHTKDLQRLLDFDCLDEVACVLGPRSSSVTKVVPGSKVFPSAPEGFTPSGSLKDLKLFSILAADRVLVGSTSSKQKPSHIFRTAKAQESRSLLISYIRKKHGTLLASDSDVWRDCKFTWEAANFSVVRGFHVGAETRWKDVFFAAESNHEVVLRNDEYFGHAAARIEEEADKAITKKGPWKATTVKKTEKGSKKDPGFDSLLRASVNGQMTEKDARKILATSKAKKTKYTLREIADAAWLLHDEGVSDVAHNWFSNPKSKESRALSRENNSVGTLMSLIAKGENYGRYGPPKPVLELDFEE